MADLFAIIARDAPNAELMRVEHRAGHLAHFAAHADRLTVAGPLQGDISGSLIICVADSAEEAEKFIKADPFYAAGVWGSVEVAAFKAASGRWSGL